MSVIPFLRRSCSRISRSRRRRRTKRRRRGPTTAAAAARATATGTAMADVSGTAVTGTATGAGTGGAAAAASGAAAGAGAAGATGTATGAGVRRGAAPLVCRRRRQLGTSPRPRGTHRLRTRRRRRAAMRRHTGPGLHEARLARWHGLGVSASLARAPRAHSRFHAMCSQKQRCSLSVHCCPRACMRARTRASRSHASSRRPGGAGLSCGDLTCMTVLTVFIDAACPRTRGAE